MKRGWVWVALLLSLGVNIGVLATIGLSRMRTKARWERSRDPSSAPPFERIANHLKLAGEPREQFMVIQKDLFRTTREHRQQMEKLETELRREVMSENPDPDRVDRLLEETGAAKRELDRAMIESVLATKQILTPEQQQRYFHVLERLRGANRRFGGRGGPPRRPRSGPRPGPDQGPPPDRD